MGRTILVSNRLPVTVSHVGGVLRVERSSGGLATGLAGPHSRGDGLWIGWPGKTWSLDDSLRAEVDARLAELRLAPVHLSEHEIQHYYEGFSNGVLWPLFHYSLERLPLHSLDWDAYRSVNERFADEVAARCGEDDTVWVHDYQLLLLPELLRQRRPRARIGFFLHIPFPASAVLRTLPRREEILRGLLGADLIGFHTQSYVRHFAAAVLRVLGLETTVDLVRHGTRETRIGSFPMGIDADEYARLGDDPRVRAKAMAARGDGSCRILLGIDRLDYTKGIARRLLAFEELLRTSPHLHERVKLVQVAVPSRSTVRAYRDQRDLVDATVGRINGNFGTSTWAPVHYMYRSLDPVDVVALYRAADVMLVTPVRDGMNLVAKEFVASRTDDDGVLVLSEFAGAAAELDGAVHVNPYDVDSMAGAFRFALDLDPAERRARMSRMRTRVATAHAGAWADRFLAALDHQARRVEDRVESSTASAERLRAVVSSVRAATRQIVLLDYDGTLVPFVDRPEDAAPDPELHELLVDLTADPRREVHLVTGRPREDLERWFGSTSMFLHAEHGLWSRRASLGTWRRLAVPGLPHDARIRAILEEFAERTPGASVEVKSSVLAWHWRRADPAFGARQANELRLHLAQLLSNVGAEVVTGDHVVEVRPYGLHKGAIVPMIVGEPDASTAVLALGDDRTDEDLFGALPEGGIAIHVGPRPSSAALRLPSHVEARELLWAIARAGR